MKICRFSYEGETHIGVIDHDRVHLFGDILTDHVASFDLNEVTMLPPASPSKIVCVGRNYADHAKELGNDVPSEPLLFLKAPSAIINDGAAIVIPTQSDQVEHEGELAIVISKKCKGLTEQDVAVEYVFGYTCLNDVTARDLQRKDGQFTRAKSFDTFCPIGPFIETDLDTTDLSVTTRVNGDVRQQGRTSQMVFSVEFLIRYISNMMTLNAGDVIATGTPSGVSKMNSGDICEVEIEGIGSLTNPVV
ncbi:MAG: fumarylacetoacetate hydrolase family protein [Chloracidobacterium sp.]|nr:fumarylacetoacetate hydrolase family protein [Chloracidobacterium sp.]